MKSLLLALIGLFALVRLVMGGPESARVAQSPTSEPASKYLFFMVAPRVVSEYWTTITMSETFVSMVAVCSVQYVNSDSIPAVVRMRNAGANSFEIRLQNPSNTPIKIGRNVHCLVAEKGSWKLPDGRKFEANLYLSDVTDHKNSWVGHKQTYMNSYESAPVIFGQVMSSNDSRWSAFWSCGKSQYTKPSTSQVRTGKHVGEDPETSRIPEVVGYVAVEQGHGSMAGVEVEARHGKGDIKGHIQGVWTESFDAPFSDPPKVVVLSQTAMHGNDGSWAVQTEAPNTLQIAVAVDEDQVGDRERFHTKEKTNYFVFSSPGAFKLSPAE